MAKDTMPLFGGSCKFYVYLYRDPRPRKKLVPIYVGKGTAKRKRADVHWRNHSHNRLLQRVLDKIRASNLEPVIEIVAWYEDEESAFSAEKHLIALFGRRNLGGGLLCNLSDGGDGPSGMVLTPEHREKLLAINTGRAKSEEEKRKISEALKGKIFTPERRANMRAAADRLKGRIVPDEQREKIRAASTGRKHSDASRAKMSVVQKMLKSTPEAKARISAIHKGRTVSLETRGKLRQANLGKTLSPAAREKVAIASRGRKHSEETRAKMSAVQKAFAATPEGRVAVEASATKRRGQKRSPDACARIRIARHGR